MSGRNQYMRDYYKTHRESILAQRKKRYKNDPEFRSKQNEMRRKSRRRKMLLDNKEEVKSSKPQGKAMKVVVQGREIITQMYTVAQFCRYNGLNRPRVAKWYESWLQRPSYTNNLNHYIYTEYEFDGLTKIIRSHRMSQAARGYKFKADTALKEACIAFYGALEKGIPKDILEEIEND